jgi:ATP-dependent Lhr-like helicase
VARSDAAVALVRGRIEHGGPTTAAQIAAFFDLDESLIAAALEALEGRGSVLRGSFSDRPSPPANGAAEPSETQWCDRRLLARIHRLTLTGLRQQIQPVEPRAYLHFLAGYHHLLAENRWGGPNGVREAIAQLQGFELPSGAWEQRILAARVAEYDPAWLDNLFYSGEVVWGRLNPPRRDDEAKPSTAALTRVVPLSLAIREELAGLLSPDEAPPAAPLRSAAAAILAALETRGALFFAELRSAANLLGAQVEEALRELAAAGSITSDSFAAVRRFVEGRHHANSRRRATRRALDGPAAPIGRWSLFPGPARAASREAYLDHWCRQLLRRWGVLFRDVLVREASAPPWHELLPRLRLMELRGEVRGGRFVGEVAGEQYALNEAVDRLRAARDQIEAGAAGEWIVISAADPVNLFGVITPPPRIAATHKNALVIQSGRLVASREARQAAFHEVFDEATQWAMRRAMTLGRRVPEASDVSASPPVQRSLLPRH